MLYRPNQKNQPRVQRVWNHKWRLHHWHVAVLLGTLGRCDFRFQAQGRSGLSNTHMGSQHWRWQRRMGRRPISWQPRCSPPVLALAQPPHTGPGRSRLRSPTAPAFRPGPGAPPPKPPKPSPGCWPRDGTRTAAPASPLRPQEARLRRALQRVLARGSAGRRGFEQTLEGEASRFCRHTWKERVPEAASPS